MPVSLKCPECGGKMVLQYSKKFKRDFYGCQNYPKCKCIHGAHPNGEPHGIPANKATRQARIEVHALFDQVWQNEGMTRQHGYRLLAHLMDIPVKDAHISRFTLADCQKMKEQWQKRYLPEYQFCHLFTSDLRRILKETETTGEGRWTVEALKAEISRREARQKETVKPTRNKKNLVRR